MPAKICGSAAGKTIRRMRSCVGMRNERAVSISVGSIPRTPSMVFRSTGKMQKNAMNEIFCRLPIECSRMIEIGSSAGGGIARQYSICGIAALRPIRERPSGMPIATPRMTAIAKPRPIRSRLGRTCVSNWEKKNSLRTSTMIVVGRGNFGSSRCTV